MAILSNKRLRGWDKKEGEDFSTWIARQDKMLKDLLDRSKRARNLINKVIYFPVADGKAWYLVDKIEPLILTHIPFGDAYEVNPIMIKGLDVEDVQEMVKRDEFLSSLFNSV